MSTEVRPSKPTCPQPYCVDGYVPTQPDGEPGPCPICNSPSNQEVPRWVTTWPYNLQPTFGSSTIDWTKVEVVPAAEYDHLMRELQEWKDSHTTNDLCLSRRIEECQRLHAALAEKEKTLDEWYRFEARLHAAMHHFGGGDIIRKAIAATGADLKAHNPLLGEAAPPAETKP